MSAPPSSLVPAVPPLLERGAQLSVIRDAATAPGGAVTVHLVGEAGSGKTALADAASRAHVAAGGTVLRTAGHEGEVRLPLAGLHQMLHSVRDRLQDLSDDDRRALERPMGGRVGGVDTMALGVALLNLLERLVESSPLLVVVDSVDWLDSMSLDVLGFVSRRLGGPAAFVVAAREAPAARRLTGTSGTRIPLPRLSPFAAAQLARRTQPHITRALLELVLIESAGLPLAVVELSEGVTLDDLRPPPTGPDVRWPLPFGDRLSTAYRPRVHAVRAAERTELLRRALDELIHESTPGLPYVLRDVDSALTSGLVTFDATSGEVCFADAIARAAVLHESTADDRQRAHRFLARYHLGSADRRATHLAQTSARASEPVAVELTSAGRRALGRGDRLAAQRWFSRASELSPTAAGRAGRAALVRPPETGARQDGCGLAAVPTPSRYPVPLHAVSHAYLLLSADGRADLALQALRVARRQLSDPSDLDAVTRAESVARLFGRNPGASGLAATLDEAVAEVLLGLPSAEPAALELSRLLAAATDATDAGRWDDALKNAALGAELAQRAGLDLVAHHFDLVRGRIHAYRGDALAARIVASTSQWASEREIAALSARSRAIEGALALSNGDVESASEALRGATAAHPSQPDHVLFDLLDATARLGSIPTQADLMPLDHPFVWATSALVGLPATTDPGTGEPSDLDGPPFDIARSLLAIAMRRRRERSPREAQALLVPAIRGFELVGAGPWALVAGRELTAASSAPRRPAAAATHPALTPQELEVARLAASGLTNKEIGQRLYLSPRTVGVHLYRAFPKLGVRSRAGLRDALGGHLAAPA